jgi:hypothetical protein
MYTIEIEKKPSNHKNPSSLSSTLVYASQHTPLSMSKGENQLVLSITFAGVMDVRIRAFLGTEQYKFLGGMYEELLKRNLEFLKIESKVHDRKISQAIQEFALKEVINHNRNHISEALNYAYEEGVEAGERKKTKQIRDLLSIS